MTYLITARDPLSIDRIEQWKASQGTVLLQRTLQVPLSFLTFQDLSSVMAASMEHCCWNTAKFGSHIETPQDNDGINLYLSEKRHRSQFNIWALDKPG